MDGDLHRLGFKLKFVYSVIGLLLGLSCIIAGVVLSLNGVTGHSSWTAELLGLSTSLNDAGPGVIVFVVGIFMVWITRFRVRDETFSTPSSDGGGGGGGDAPPIGSRGGGSSGVGMRRRIMYYRK